MNFKERPSNKREVKVAESKPREYRKLISGGLAGFSGVCVVQLLGIGHLDVSLTIAVYAFMIAIPLLVKDLADAQSEEHHGITINLKMRITATVTGITSSMVGISAIFWHFSQWIGMLFILLSFWCAYSHFSYSDSLSEEVSHKD